MQREAVLVMSLGVGLSLAPRTAAEPAEARPLRVEIVDTYRLLPRWAKSTVSQVESLFERVGVSIEGAETTVPWIDDGGRRKLLIFIRNNLPEEIGLARGTLGAVLSRSEPQRLVFVFLPAIARTMEIELAGMLSAEEERELALALSRVIVHEAFHAIVPDLPHAEAGLTRASLTRRFLGKLRAEVDAESAAVFRAELAKLGEWPPVFRRPSPPR